MNHGRGGGSPGNVIIITDNNKEIGRGKEVPTPIHLMYKLVLKKFFNFIERQ